MQNEKLIRFSITVPEELLKEFESSYEKLENRSEALRNLMRNYVAGERWKNNNREVYATITIVYDHHLPELTRKLTAAQHDYGEVIICSQHVHLNHETCLECVITKGLANEIQKFIEALKAIRGIKSLNVNVSAEI